MEIIHEGIKVTELHHSCVELYMITNSLFGCRSLCVFYSRHCLNRQFTTLSFSGLRGWPSYSTFRPISSLNSHTDSFSNYLPVRASTALRLWWVCCCYCWGCSKYGDFWPLVYTWSQLNYWLIQVLRPHRILLLRSWASKYRIITQYVICFEIQYFTLLLKYTMNMPHFTDPS